MKTKNAFIALATVAITMSAHAGTINFASLGKTGTYCPGQTLSIDLDQGRSYVEKLLVSAEGIRKDGFIKVYADGELVHNIGVPGYDPDYSFRVRRIVKNLSFKFEETCSRIIDGKVFTEEVPESYRPYRRSNVKNENWGQELLEIVNSLSVDLYEDPQFASIWKKVLLPMKKIAILQSVSDQVRDERSLITAHRSLKMAKIIIDNQSFLDGLLETSNFDYVVSDLLRIKEDILERHDVKAKDVPKMITELEKELDL